MKKHVIIVLFAACLLLSPGFALAQYGNSTDPTTVTSMADLREGSDPKTNIDRQGYYEPGFMGYGGRPNPAQKLSFYERLSNFGDCDWIPPSSICLIYSDNYKWIVSDYWIDPHPILVGSGNCLPIELIRCYKADYYHILGTSLVAIDKRDPKIFIRTPYEICPPNQCHPY